METLEVTSRAAWRRWLRARHAKQREIWLVFYKVGSGKRTFCYREALDEALCWGWIDSLVRRLDEERYAQKFTPRSNPGKWSPTNVQRMRELIAAGEVRPSGLAAMAPKVLAQVQAGEPVRPRAAPEMPTELESLLASSRGARASFEALPPSARRQFMGWVGQAVRPETRLKRAREAAELLERGERLGLK